MSAAAAIAVPIVLEAARRIGAPLVERVLRERLGDTAGDIAGAVLDTVARNAGIEHAENLDAVEPANLEQAVEATERAMPEILLAQVEQQREANRLQLAEMDKGTTWSWAWRPATMWLIGFFWLWSLVLVPVVNAGLAATIPVFLQELIWLTTTYLALYMGGHTIKAGIETWKEAKGR